MNGGDGIQLGMSSSLTNSSAFANFANGVFTGPNCHVSNVVANDNDANGAEIGPSSTLVASVTGGNGDNGVFFLASNRITDCVSEMNGFMSGTGDGFFCPGPPGGSVLGGCTAFNNAEHGYSALPPGPGPSGAAAHDCSAVFNGFAAGAGDGFNNFKSVMQCTANFNAGNGIETAVGGHVYRNTCQSNGAAGILATLDGNVIEQNNVAFNAGAGIMTTPPGGNMIAGNRSHANAPPYALAVGETAWAIFGPGPIPAAINANANITY